MDFKKSVLALLALGLTGVASAGGFMPAPACTNHPVTVPCERTAWDLGFTAYWVRPTSDFASLFGGFDENYSFADTSHAEWDLDHKWGFGAEASYHWGTGNDLNFNWTHFHKGYEYDWDYSSDFYNTNLHVDFDSVNLELGQQINAGPNWDLRAHMGLSYAKIRISIDSLEASSDTDRSNGSGDYTVFESKVDGFGPRTGFDLGYRISDNFSIVGHTAVSLLAGERESGRWTGDSTAFVRDIDAYAGLERHSVMLGAEGKIGLAYTANFAQGTGLIEGGYSAVTYHNGIDAFGLFTSPFNLDGFYIKAKYVS